MSGPVAPPASVTVCECWARDGLQSWPTMVGLPGKLDVLRAALAAGVVEIDATSLVPPRYAPQFGDAEALLEALAGTGVSTGVSIRVLAPNRRGVERAVRLRERFGLINTVGFPISASEAHNLANVRRSHAEHLAAITDMVRCAHDGGLRVIVAVATAYGCPIVGDVAESTVFDIAGRLVELGVDRLMLSDTTGLADPVRAARYTERAVREFPGVELVAHFHDTRGAGIANTFAAVLAGATCVDACLGGIGGEPATVEQNHAGETGNVSTEDIVVLLHRAGIATGINPDALIAAGRRAVEVLGTTTRSQVQATGHGLTTRGAQP
jgi:hydroxymethylglutaryl-CoA lyase